MGQNLIEVSLKELMVEFDVSYETINDWVNDDGMPKAGYNKYNMLECYRWRTKRLANSLKEARSFTNKSGLDREKIRQTAADAEIKEIKAAQLRGELIPLDVYERNVGAVFGFVRQGFLTLPGRAAPQLEGLDRIEIKDRLMKAIREALAGLSEEEIYDRAIRDTRDAAAVDLFRHQPGAGEKPPAGKPKSAKKPRAAARGKRKPMGGAKPRIAKRRKQQAGAVAH